MAINKYNPHLYDAEYVGGGSASATVREIILFNREASTSVSYLDATGAAVNRAKGFEDTNLTEGGRITETGMILDTLGLNIVPGDDYGVVNYWKDRQAFFERGFAELIVNESQVLFTARIRDLVMPNKLEMGGALANTVAERALSLTHSGQLYQADKFKIPRGVRFKLRLAWDRPMTILKTARIEACIYADAWDDEANDSNAARALEKQKEKKKAPKAKV
jgi:hypothetical protein